MDRNNTVTVVLFVFHFDTQTVLIPGICIQNCPRYVLTCFQQVSRERVADIHLLRTSEQAATAAAAAAAVFLV